MGKPHEAKPPGYTTHAPIGGEHGAGFITITSCSWIASSAHTDWMKACHAGSAAHRRPPPLAIGQALVGPDQDDPVQPADLRHVEADEAAEMALLDRQAVRLVTLSQPSTVPGRNV